jgi:hypothetical protein
VLREAEAGGSLGSVVGFEFLWVWSGGGIVVLDEVLIQCGVSPVVLGL